MSAVDALPLTLCGIGSTMRGACDLASGDLSDGAKSVFLGLCTTNVGGRFQGLDPQSHSKLMKMTCYAATGAAALQGVARFGTGVREKNWAEVLKGGVQTAAGVVGSLFVHSLDPKTIVVANQASAAALGSAFIAKLGWQDLVKGRYLSGISKVLLGTAGVASAGYYAYSSCIDQPSSLINQPSLSVDQIAFLESHKTEIEEMYKGKKPIGKWQKLGKGISKIALVHPDLSEMLIKIPVGEIGHHQQTGEGDLLLHYRNLQEAQIVVKENAFDRIIIPHSHLFLTSKGTALVEQRLDLIAGMDVPDSPDKDEALTQFSQLIQKTGLAALYPDYAHNAGFIKQTNPMQMGIIDFDYKERDVERTLYSVGVFSWGYMLLDVASEVVKETLNIKPENASRFGFGAGVIGGLLGLACPHRDISIITAGIGFGMCAAAQTLMASAWIKNSLASLVPKFNSPFAGSIG